jgi:hypothetical protein
VGNPSSREDGHDGKVPRKAAATKGKNGSKAAAAKAGVNSRRR